LVLWSEGDIREPTRSAGFLGTASGSGRRAEVNPRELGSFRAAEERDELAASDESRHLLSSRNL
jgi:hypothetical protein